MTRSTIVLASLLAFGNSASAASLPGILPVQGRLVDADAVPVTDAELTFRLRDGQGDVLYAETPAVAFDDNGFFTAYLGEFGDLDLTLFRDNAAVTLEVDIDGDDTAIGPFELGQVPYAGFAYLAGDAETFGGRGPEDFLSIDDVPSYSAGWGLDLSGTGGREFSVDQTELDTVFATDAEVSKAELDKTFATDAAVATALASKRSTSVMIDWSELSSVPWDLADGDQDTLYWADDTQGAVLLSPSTNRFSLDQDVIEDWALGVCYDTESELTAVLDDLYVSKDSSGKVGIGTSTPSDLLDVNGTLRVGSVRVFNDPLAFDALRLEQGSAANGVGIHSGGSQRYAVDADSDSSGAGFFWGKGAKSTWTEWMRVWNGNVGIGTTAPTSKLDVAGEVKATAVTSTGTVTAPKVASTGQLSSQGGKVQRDFLTWNIAQFDATNPWGPPTHVQIKTNIPVKSNIMYRLQVEGYHYGSGKAINSDAVGYTYVGWDCIGSNSVNDYAGGAALSQYCSSDGYVVLRLTVSSHYYMGFAVSAWFVNPNGGGFDISGQVFLQDADL